MPNVTRIAEAFVLAYLIVLLAVIVRGLVEETRGPVVGKGSKKNHRQILNNPCLFLQYSSSPVFELSSHSQERSSEGVLYLLEDGV